MAGLMLAFVLWASRKKRHHPDSSIYYLGVARTHTYRCGLERNPFQQSRRKVQETLFPAGESEGCPLRPENA